MSSSACEVKGEGKRFLADRTCTNGRAYATVLRPSLCRRLSVVVVCDVMWWLNDAS